VFLGEIVFGYLFAFDICQKKHRPYFILFQGLTVVNRVTVSSWPASQVALPIYHITPCSHPWLASNLPW